MLQRFRRLFARRANAKIGAPDHNVAGPHVANEIRIDGF
jgi:hypothetical protein